MKSVVLALVMAPDSAEDEQRHNKNVPRSTLLVMTPDSAEDEQRHDKNVPRSSASIYIYTDLGRHSALG